MHTPILIDLVVILSLSIAVILLFQALKLPSVLGFLVTGVIAGPNALSLVTNQHDVEILAEIGVVLLLFTIGIEFSLKELGKLKRIVLIGGSVQVLLTVAAVAAATQLFGFDLGTAVFLGFLFSLSSTAVVLKILQEKGEVESPHGRSILSILIFQDIIVIPMMLVTPLLAQKEMSDMFAILNTTLKGIVVVCSAIVLASLIVPKLLHVVAETRSRELFLFSVVVVCFMVASITSSIGLSVALGAFLAGLVISESEYSYQAVSNVLPFSGVFTSLFFVSVGMLLDVNFLLEHPLQITAITLAIILAKSVIASSASFLLGLPLRTIIIVGLSLNQVGEFSFILSKVGLANGLLTDTVYQYFLAVSILTMGLTPLMMKLANKLGDKATKYRLPEELQSKLDFLQSDVYVQPSIDAMEDHLVIIGYGVNGRNLAAAAKQENIPYMIVELNPETVREERQKGEPILFGDAMNEKVLERAHLSQARVVSIAISDYIAARDAVLKIRHINNKAHIIIRARYIARIFSKIKVFNIANRNTTVKDLISFFQRTKLRCPNHNILTWSFNLKIDSIWSITTQEGSRLLTITRSYLYIWT